MSSHRKMISNVGGTVADRASACSRGCRNGGLGAVHFGEVRVQSMVAG